MALCPVADQNEQLSNFQLLSLNYNDPFLLMMSVMIFGMTEKNFRASYLLGSEKCCQIKRRERRSETVGCQNGDLTKNDSDVYLPLCLSGDSKKCGIRFYKPF